MAVLSPCRMGLGTCARMIHPNNQLLLYLEKVLTREADSDVLSHLLEALSIAVTNSPFIREKAKDSLVNSLSAIAVENGKKVDRRTTDLAIKILAAISEGEYRYNILLPIYEVLIKNKSQ